MGVELNYFFNYPKEIGDLIRDIDDNLWPCNWRLEREIYWGGFLGINFWIAGNDALVNDLGMDFESYRYCISTKLVYRPAMYHQAQAAVMLSLIYMLYEQMEVKNGMLTWDVYWMLAKYEERAEALYDIVSGTSFTNFDEHLKIIRAKFSKNWRDKEQEAT